jgi:hypothetical protein
VITELFPILSTRDLRRSLAFYLLGGVVSSSQRGWHVADPPVITRIVSCLGWVTAAAVLPQGCVPTVGPCS